MSSAVTYRRSARIRAVFDKEFGDAFAVRAKNVIVNGVKHAHPLQRMPRKIWGKYRCLVLERLLEVLEEVFVELCGRDDDDALYRRALDIPSLYTEYLRCLTNKRAFKDKMTLIEALKILTAKAVPKYAQAMAESSDMPLEICEIIAQKCPTFNNLDDQLAQARKIYSRLVKQWHPYFYWG